VEHRIDDVTHLFVSPPLIIHHGLWHTGRRDKGNLVNGFKATSNTATQFKVGENPGVFAKSLLTFIISYLHLL